MLVHDRRLAERAGAPPEPSCRSRSGAEQWRRAVARLARKLPPARPLARARGRHRRFRPPVARIERRLHAPQHTAQWPRHPATRGCRTRRSSTPTLRTSARAVCATRFGECSPSYPPRRAGAQSSAVCADRNGSRRVGPHARRTRTAVRVRAADCATHWSQLVPLVDRAAQGTR